MKHTHRFIFKLAAMAVAVFLVLGLLFLATGQEAPAEMADDASGSETGALPATPLLTLGYSPADGFNPYIVNSSLVVQNSGLLFERLVEITRISS